MLAPALFCRAIDWILDHMKGLSGVTVGREKFTDFDYADNVALPVSSVDSLTTCLGGFSEASQTMGLNVSWPKTKVQCLGASQVVTGISVMGQEVEMVDQFCYFGSIQDSGGRCRPDILRRLGIASSSMNALARVWSQGRLSLKSKLRLYQTCILPVLLYGSDTWTLLKADVNRLQAFHMRCQRRILGVKWQDKIRNVTISEKTGLPPVTDIIEARRAALFGHVVRLGERTPAHRVLRIAVRTRLGISPSASWKRPPGRPRDAWLKPFLRSSTSLETQWEDARNRSHGQPAQRLLPDMRP